MTKLFTDHLREWVSQIQSLHAQPVQPAKPSPKPIPDLPGPTSAGCAGSACSNAGLADRASKPTRDNVETVSADVVLSLTSNRRVYRARRRSRWWTLGEGESGTCGRCHPPAAPPHLVRWLDGDATTLTPNNSPRPA